MTQNFLGERHTYGWSPPLQVCAILSTFPEPGGPGTSYFPPHDGTVTPHKTSKFNDKQINILTLIHQILSIFLSFFFGRANIT